MVTQSKSFLGNLTFLLLLLFLFLPRRTFFRGMDAQDARRG